MGAHAGESGPERFRPGTTGGIVGGFNRIEYEGMRGIVVFAILTAIMAVVDAAFFKGRYLNDAETAITGLAALSMRIGHR